MVLNVHNDSEFEGPITLINTVYLCEALMGCGYHHLLNFFISQ